ncbi:hypothetical protein F511_45573 [Dorcoceras hygrometricum]|uniref:Uncharacterized protein n=1 Tax=Dorcoceras hygrometricum TaxID=472368 RepID=A0A2Z6ZVN3_9LAMI|nr:hypothetical protein F511_45573 [Dorcoceras hygrometricum]
MAGQSCCCFAQVLRGVAPTSCCSFSHGGRLDVMVFAHGYATNVRQWQAAKRKLLRDQWTMPAHWMQPTGHLLAGRRPLDARGCAAHVATCAVQHGGAMHDGGGRRPACLPSACDG